MCCGKSLWFLLILILLSLVQSHKICKLDNIDCTTHIASRAYKYVMDGIKGLIEPTETLYLNKVQGEIKPDLRYTLSNLTLTNMKECEVKQLIVKEANLTYTCYLRCPQLVVHFDFEGMGTLGTGTLSIDDQAQVKVTLDDYLLIFKGLYGKFISEKDHEPRLFIKENHIETETKGRATFKKYNLIRGSNERLRETEEYLNKHSKEMTEFLQSPMMEDFMKQFIDKINIYLKTHTQNEVLLME